MGRLKDFASTGEAVLDHTPCLDNHHSQVIRHNPAAGVNYSLVPSDKEYQAGYNQVKFAHAFVTSVT